MPERLVHAINPTRDSMEFTATARWLGIATAATTVVLEATYAVTLAVGFFSMESPNEPIGDPMFSILEVLILLLMPAMVALMVAVHAWAPKHAKSLSLISVIFMSLLAGLTCSVHFVILTLSRHALFAGQSWLPLVLSFNWPSVVYALDVLGWDVFFALSMFFAAPVFRGSRVAAWIRGLMIAGGLLAIAGTAGAIVGDMYLRNIGIVGYVGVFLVIAVLLARLFYQTTPRAD